MPRTRNRSEDLLADEPPVDQPYQTKGGSPDFKGIQSDETNNNKSAPSDRTLNKEEDLNAFTEAQLDIL